MNKIKGIFAAARLVVYVLLCSTKKRNPFI